MVSGAETPLFGNTTPASVSALSGAVGRSAQNLPSPKKEQVDNVALSPEALELIESDSALPSVDSPEETGAGPELNFKKVVEEFQKSLDDENRIPPSIFNQMQKLLEKSFEDDREKSVDRIA